MTYGPTHNGFNRKRLFQVLDEIEVENSTVFGPGLIQTSQSPMGQLNGLRADLIADLWEALEDVYQSFDPEQAEGSRLDMLARYRLITRQPGEGDLSLRQAIQNVGVASIRDADFYRSVLNVDGVTWARIHSNDTGDVDDNGVPGHSVSVAAIGGDDQEIAQVIRQFVTPGIWSYGNITVSTMVDGFCRDMGIMRPEVKPIGLNVGITKWKDSNGCPPPTNAAISEALLAGLTGDNRPPNGQDITKHMIKTIISCVFPNVNVSSISGGFVGDGFGSLPIMIDFNEIASIVSDNIVVTSNQ